MTTATQCAGLATLLALTTASPSFAQTRTTMPNGYPSHYCLPTTVDSAEEQKVYCEGWRTFRQVGEDGLCSSGASSADG